MLNLKAVRRKCKYTHAELSTITNIPEQVIALAEQGKQTLKPEEAKILSIYLGFDKKIPDFIHKLIIEDYDGNF